MKDMTQEDKNLLLKDLCARLPYGVKVHINSPIEEQNSMELFDVNLDSEHIGIGNKKWTFRAIPVIDNEDESKVVKPYLLPMSSMTDEEYEQYRKFSYYGAAGYRNNDYKEMISIPSFEKMDFLNAHHFDYRGLIEKGLALQAPEGMYNIK